MKYWKVTQKGKRCKFLFDINAGWFNTEVKKQKWYDKPFYKSKSKCSEARKVNKVSFYP